MLSYSLALGQSIPYIQLDGIFRRGVFPKSLRFFTNNNQLPYSMVILGGLNICIYRNAGTAFKTWGFGNQVVYLLSFNNYYYIWLHLSLSIHSVTIPPDT